MATHWRIRHKLLLGLGLTVAVLALLVGGTLRGLWSYYVTTDTIRAKNDELKAAEVFRDEVAVLTAPDSLKSFRHEPDGVPPARLKAARTLADFEEVVQKNLRLPSYAGDGEHALGLVAALNAKLEGFEAAVWSEAERPGFLDVGEPGAGSDRKDRASVAERSSELRKDAQDLRDGIYQDLDRSLSGTRRHYQVTLWIVVPSSCVGLLGMAGLLRSFYAWVLCPIRDLEAGVKRIAQGDFAQRIELHSGDEMEDLAHAFNDMAGRLQELYGDLARQVNDRSRQLVRSERLASVGFLAAGVAHEINNPLASIAFCSEALEARLGDLLRQARAAGRGEDYEVFAKYLKMIQEEAFRCKKITERLLEFSRTGERRREPVDLTGLVQSVLDLTQHLQNSRGKHLALEVDADRVPGGRITAPVNSEEIKSVVLNLVVNALDSMDEGGRLTVRLRQRDGMAELAFTDTGCGMNQEVLENIFEPFFTRSRTGKGTGLGLTISHRIVNQHGGEIEAASDGPGHGSTFTVRLPVQAADSAPTIPGPGPDAGRVPARLAAPGMAA